MGAEIRSKLAYVGVIISLALIYATLAIISFKLAPQHAHVPAFWPAWGMALFAYILYGSIIWPAILLGSAIFTQYLNVPWPSAIISSFGDTLSPMIGSWLLSRIFKINFRLDTIQDAVILILFGIIIPTSIGGIIGTFSLYVENIVPVALLKTIFLTWWLGDLAGALILTPLLLSYCFPVEAIYSRRHDRLELILLFSLLITTCWLLFVQNFAVLVSNMLPLYTLLFFVTWGALRYNIKVTSSILMIACLFSLYGSLHFFPHDQVQVRGKMILHFQILLGTLAAVGLLLSAAIRQHLDNAEKLRENMTMLQVSEERLKLAIGAANMGIWTWDMTTGKVYWTGKVDELFGLNEGEFPETFEAFMSYIYPEDRPKVQKAIDESIVRADSKYAVEYRIFWRGGELHWIESIGHVFGDDKGRPIKMAGVVRDVTVKKEFTSMRETLFEQERKARVEAEKSIQQRDEFLSVASHELRTPLTSLLMGIQLIKRQIEHSNFDKTKTESLLRSIDKAELNINRFIKLVTNLLDVSQMTSERFILDLKTFNLSDHLKEIIERFRPEFEQSRCPLHVDIEDNIVGKWDIIRIEQVVTNLFTNAMKYSIGKPVDIYLKRQHGQAVLTVRDHGIGMPKDGVDKIFERFERIGPTREYGGLGLGLFITKNIVEAHSGTIEVESEPNRGSSFIIKLPISK